MICSRMRALHLIGSILENTIAARIFFGLNRSYVTQVSSLAVPPIGFTVMPSAYAIAWPIGFPLLGSVLSVSTIKTDGDVSTLLKNSDSSQDSAPTISYSLHFSSNARR